MSAPTRNRPAPVAVSFPQLQWANGRPVFRPFGTSARFQPLVGWHIEQGKDPDLDAHAAELNVPRIDIKHMRPGGAEIKTHWHLGEEARIYPLIDGLLADALGGACQIADRSATEVGIVADWPRGEGSYLALLALVEVGGAVYPAPLRLSMAGTITDSLYRALLRHIEVCTAADELVGTLVPCGWLALPLTAGPELDAGRSDTTTIVTVADAHAEPFDLDYIKTVALPKQLREHAVALTTDAKRWAVEALNYRRNPQEGR
jgi:hypothetical protein